MTLQSGPGQRPSMQNSPPSYRFAVQRPARQCARSEASGQEKLDWEKIGRQANLGSGEIIDAGKKSMLLLRGGLPHLSCGQRREGTGILKGTRALDKMAVSLRRSLPQEYSVNTCSTSFLPVCPPLSIPHLLRNRSSWPGTGTR